MSHRAIERLRRERQAEILPVVGDDSDEDDSDEDDTPMNKKANVFAAGMFDSDSDSDSDEFSDEDSDEVSDNGSVDDPGVVDPSTEKVNNSQKEAPEVEDLDAILQEYKLQDAEQEDLTTTNDEDLTAMQYSIITSNMEIRDLDIEFVRRSLFGGADVNESASSSRRSHRNNNLFGTPSDNWPRPPHYVGGGIGFKAYSDSKESSSQKLPWPYSDMKDGDPRCPPLKDWFQFINSDSYQRDYKDMQMIQNTGDANAMLLFIAHHPFVVESLLQISIVMYQMNQGREGLSFLKRALWIFECATPNSFLKAKTRTALMDFEKDGNKTFFSTLFRLIRVSYVGGLTRTAFAVSQFLLSLDPLRDPMKVLLAIDHFGLMCNTEASNTWLVDFVESKKVYVPFRDGESQEEFECQILDLPNWGFSFALALFNLNLFNANDDTMEKATSALKNAILQFPSVVGLLLSKNEVDISSRSVRIDWPTAVKYLDELESEFQKRNYEAYSSDTVTRARISQAYDTILQIYIQQNSKLWSSSNVLAWVYNSLVALKEETQNSDLDKVTPLSPAIIRYISSDPSDYEDKFQTMPADANPFDPNVVALALNIDPNRRRLVRRNQRQAAANFIDENGNAFAAREQNFLGPATTIIDPDLPLLEVFWRSALPWARVEGVPPANR